MNLEQTLGLRYMDRMLATPQGRAHVLSQLADAEANGEGAVFDRLLSQVDDPELSKMIRRHAADEVMHAELFRSCIPRTGLPAPVVPDHLKMIDKLDVAVGGFMNRGVESKTDVMHAYVLLQVIEERAVEQFEIFAKVFRKYDAKTADVIERIAKDEERHLKYCHAIARRYAPDAKTLADTLERYRTIEADVFAENGRANMKYALDNGYLAVGFVEKLFWRGMLRLGQRAEAPRPTRFHKNAPVTQTLTTYAEAA